MIPTDPVSNEDIMLKEHEEFMSQVSESGVPIHLLRIYGESTNTNNNDNNQKTGKAGDNQPTPGPSV